MSETNIAGSEESNACIHEANKFLLCFFGSVSTNCDRDFLYDWVWCYMKIGGCMNVGKIIM